MSTNSDSDTEVAKKVEDVPKTTIATGGADNVGENGVYIIFVCLFVLTSVHSFYLDTKGEKIPGNKFHLHGLLPGSLHNLQCLNLYPAVASTF